MRTFVLVEVQDNAVSDTTVYGSDDVVSIIIDWDTIETEPAEAADLIEQIKDRYPDDIVTDQSVKDVIDRLQEIVDEDEEFDEEEDIEDDLDDEDLVDLDDEDDDEDEDEYEDEDTGEFIASDKGSQTSEPGDDPDIAF